MQKEQSKVSAGEGYRLLKLGEKILATDEVCGTDSGWGTTKPVYEYWVGRSVDCLDCPIRRAVPVPAYDPPEISDEVLEDGWRLLHRDETIREGDQLYYRMGWVPAGDSRGSTPASTTTSPNYAWRRKYVKAGEGYRLLRAEDVVQIGDERGSCTFGDYEADPWKASTYWIKVACGGLSIGKIVGKQGLRFPVRRKVAKAQPAQPASCSAPYCGTAFRILEKGETIQSGDDYWSTEYLCWNPCVGDIGHRVWIDGYGYPTSFWRRAIIKDKQTSLQNSAYGHCLQDTSCLTKATERDFSISPGDILFSPTKTVWHRQKLERPDPGYGYRLLAGDESLAFGDEVWVEMLPGIKYRGRIGNFEKNWNKISSSNGGLGRTIKDLRAGRAHRCKVWEVRRKVEIRTATAVPVPEGYRFVHPGEILLASDLFWSEGVGPWTVYEGSSSECSIGTTCWKDQYPVIREVIPAPVKTVMLQAGEGHRLLAAHEEVRTTDEWTYCFTGLGSWQIWMNCNWTKGQTVEQARNNWKTLTFMSFRRKLEPIPFVVTSEIFNIL